MTKKSKYYFYASIITFTMFVGSFIMLVKVVS